MDSNVSKRTFLHKFFKLRFNQEKKTLSVKELLKQAILSTIDLAQDPATSSLDIHFVNSVINEKIMLLHSSIESISSPRQIDGLLLTSKLSPIVYSCTIAFPLASHSKKTPQIVARELGNLLIASQDKTNFQSDLNFSIEIGESGLINFYLNYKSLAIWLAKSWGLLNRKITKELTNLDLSLEKSECNPSLDFFLPQYVHARCCSLLRLGTREKLFFSTKNFPYTAWLKDEHNLWLQEEVEFILLRQLFVVTDSFAQKSVNWKKLVLNFSEAILLFLGECRFLGKVRQETPQKAIARLGLIALSQYWLQRILVEKLEQAALTNV